MQSLGPGHPNHFPPAGLTGLPVQPPPNGQLELFNKRAESSMGQVLKAFQKKMTPNRSSAPPICSSSVQGFIGSCSKLINCQNRVKDLVPK